VSRSARIPALLRELADAFEDLLAEQKPRKRARRLTAPDGPPPDPQAIESVRRKLRRQGIAA
jgi:hypothetical protein